MIASILEIPGLPSEAREGLEMLADKCQWLAPEQQAPMMWLEGSSILNTKLKHVPDEVQSAVHAIWTGRNGEVNRSA